MRANHITTIHIIWGELAVSLYRRGTVNNTVRLAHAVYDFLTEQEGEAFLLGISEARKPHEWAQVTRVIDIRTLGAPMRSRLLQAIADGNLELVEDMLDAGVSPETKGPDGMNALQLAAQHGQVQIAETLLNRGAPPEEPIGSTNPHSAIHLAATSPSPEAAKVVDLLSQRKIDLERADREGKTALMRAIETAHLGAAVVLLAQGALTKTMDNDSKTARNHFDERFGAVVGDEKVDMLHKTLIQAEERTMKSEERAGAMMKQPKVRPTPYGTRY